VEMEEIHESITEKHSYNNQFDESEIISQKQL